MQKALDLPHYACPSLLNTDPLMQCLGVQILKWLICMTPRERQLENPHTGPLYGLICYFQIMPTYHDDINAKQHQLAA